MTRLPTQTALVFLLLACCASQLPAARPNILLVVVDDQSPLDLKIYNERSTLDTPALDRLAKEGMVIDDAYHMGSWSGAVCTPSRHMIMTGRSVWHVRGKANPKRKKRNDDLPGKRVDLNELAQESMPAIFNRAGYDTMRTCKRGNSFEGANALFTVRKDATRRGGTVESGSQWHGQQVLDYLSEREKTQDSDPFLIYFGFSHPHDTRDGPPELLDKYGATNHKDRDSLPTINDKTPELPINYLPAHPFHHGQPGLRDEEKVSGVWEKRDEQTIRNEMGREYACSENIDTQVGRVLEKLKSMGELDNTYVIYTSDHGIAIGRHGLQGKQNLYQHTWRVPFIVRGPGIKAGTRAAGNIYLMDILGTLCDLSEIDPPKSIESISFRGVLEGKQSTVRDVLYGVYCGGTKPGMRCVRKGDWKLIKYDVLDGQVRETQLFNLKQNPHEFLSQHAAPDVAKLLRIHPEAQQTDLAEDPNYARQRKELEALLSSEMKRLDDPYTLWDQPQH